jgi:ABC-type multidrug transport system ATPase subunit
MTGAAGPRPATNGSTTEGRPAAALDLDRVERRYGERVALAGVTVRLAAGETLAVLGPNGAGKTTLLRVLATLLRPHAGVVRVLGHELPREAWRVRGGIGYLGHDPLLYRELTGRENLQYHARLHGLMDRPTAAHADAAGQARPHEGFASPGGHKPSSGETGRGGPAPDEGLESPGRHNPSSGPAGGGEEAVGLARVEERLEAVGMARRADEPVRDLSKGMVQRLAVARATLHDPELLLLDEPRANLDPAAAEALEPLIGRASGKTRVLVTHDVEGGLAEADVALGLRGGTQAFCRPAGEIDAATARGLYS